MRSLILGVFGLALCAGSAQAFELPAGNKAESVVGVTVQNIYLKGSDINVDLQLDLSQVKMKSNVETVYTPMFVNGNDTLRMTPFSVVGRNRLYWERRNDAMEPITFYKGELVDRDNSLVRPYTLYRSGEKNYNLELTTPYRDWMETAYFDIDVQSRGCANCVKGAPVAMPLAQNDFVQRSFFPEFLYVTPVAEAVKMREISARAYIDFPVNRIEIYPDYRRNPDELAKIRATIDSVKNDKDISITSLHISGTASPEGGYQNNIRLAKGRTESLKDYVQSLYRFPQGLITTSFEPVDWAGLAEFLKMVVDLRNGTYQAQHKSEAFANVKEVGDIKGDEENLKEMTLGLDSIRFDQFQNIDFDPATICDILPNAARILAIVDSNIEPFERNNKIKFTYKDEYAWLLANVYPALRHSDYRIQFEIKTYTEVSEIIEVMQEAPQKLSLAELFVAANSQPQGSELYNEAFELAVTMYPEDEIANMNAANAAMQRGDLIQAERYLSRISESPENDYSRAMLTLMKGDVETATAMFRSLSNSLNPDVAKQASAALAGLEEVARENARTFIPVE